MFNLNRAIADWRRQMAASGIKAREVLDELESHLREDVERHRQSGEDEQSAFEAAVKQIGPPQALTREFAKLHGCPITPKRKLAYVGCFGCAALVLLTGTWTFLASEGTWRERLFGCAAVCVFAFYLAGLPFLFDRLSVARNRRVWEAIRIAAVLACPAWTLLLFMPVGLGLAPHLIIFAISAILPPTLLAAAWQGRSPLNLQRDISYLYEMFAFTPVAQRSLEIAREEAGRLHHDFVGTEHLLLGLLQAGQGGHIILEKLGLEVKSVRAEIEKIVGPGFADSLAPMRPCTPRLKRAIELGAREAKASKLACVETRHIFLGLLLEGSGIAAVVLKKLGVKADAVRQALTQESGLEFE